jgi:cytochrome c
MMKTVLAVACATMLKLGLALAADAPAQSHAPKGQPQASPGQIAFNTYCRTCHSWIKGDNRLGPSLYGVVGRKAGTAPGYALYSQSMKDAGWIWTEAMINDWITDPYKILPNTNMKPFPGIHDEAERKKIITFLKSNRDK